QGVPDAAGHPAGPAGRGPGTCPGREPGADGRVGQRQEHAAAPRRRARPRRPGCDLCRRAGAARNGRARAGAVAPLRDRADLPAVQPGRQPDGRRQPRLPGKAGRAPRSALAGRAGRSARAGDAAGALSGAAVRRTAAARGAGPRAGIPAVAGAGRRADRQPGRGDRRRGAGPAAVPGGGQPRDAVDGHPPSPRGRAAAADRGSPRRAGTRGPARVGASAAMSVFGWTLHALAGHWRRHPVQFFSLFTGLWLATALLTGVLAINAQVRASYALASELVGGTPHVRLEPADGRPLPRAAFGDLRRQGWPVSPVLEGRVQLAEAGPRLRILGVEPLSLPPGSEMAGESLGEAGLVGFISPPGQAWIADQTLTDAGLEEGDAPMLDNGERLPPLQVRPDMAPGTVLVDIGVAERVLQARGEITRLLLPADAEGTLPVPWNTRLRWERSGENELDRLTGSFHLNLTALGLLAFAVGLFIVHAAIGLALEQRRP